VSRTHVDAWPVTGDAATATAVLPTRDDTPTPVDASALVIEHDTAEQHPVEDGRADAAPVPAAVPAGVDVQEQARQAYRDSVTAGEPLNGKQLGALFDRSERWGRDRIKEAKPTLPRAARRRVAAGSRKPARAATVPPAPAAAVRVAAENTHGSEDASHGTPNGTATPVPSGVAAAAADTDQRQPPTPPPAAGPTRRRRPWALLALAAPAFVAIWSGWVGLGEMTGFGLVHPLPGIADGFAINSAITLPIGVEAYAAYALRVWLARVGSARGQRVARVSAIGALILGGVGQVAYHLMSAAGIGHAPWWITTFVACLPVVVLGAGAGLAHLHYDTTTHTADDAPDGEETA
jgi:hypothetical protein